MPYAFGGLAVGRAEVSRFANVSYVLWDDYDVTSNGVTTHFHQQIGSGSMTQSEKRTNSFMYGWTAGLGVEYMVWDCLFLRGEWEHVGFSPVKNISVNLNNFRLGAGYKF